MLFWPIVVVVFLLLGALFFRVFRSLWKALLSAVGIISFVLCILGAAAVIDARDFAEKSQTRPQLFILEENSRMLAGVNDLFKPDEGIKKALTDDEFSYYSALHEQKDHKAMLGNKYRLFVMSMGAFESLTEEDFRKHEEYTKDFVFMMLRSDNAVEVFVEHMLNESGAGEDYEGLLREKLLKEAPGKAELKSGFFRVLVSASVKTRGPMFVFKEYKRGNVKIYPETMFFRTIKIMPLSMLDQIEGITNGTAKEE